MKHLYDCHILTDKRPIHKPTGKARVKGNILSKYLSFLIAISPKYITICFLLFTGSLLAGTNPTKGYIVTKDGLFLSGYIGDIYHSPRASVVTFINDMGDIYHLEAELVKGFVCQNNKAMDAYKSQLIGRRWFFLKVMVESDGLVLYQAPLEISYRHNSMGISETRTRTTAKFWLEWRNRSPERIQRINYRKKLRYLFKERAPALAEKVGKKGYRFNDMPSIIEEYCAILKEKRRPRS